MITILNPAKKYNLYKMISQDSKNVEFGINIITTEVLDVIFNLALINFNDNQSKYTIGKNFKKFLKKNKNTSIEDFKNFIFELNEQLNDIAALINLKIKVKIGFTKKSINLDELIDSISNCYVYCD